jgi:maleate isomerase
MGQGGNQMAQRVRLGMLTPSSNTTLEPVAAAMLAGLDGVTAHFARFPVTEISLTPRALAQFDNAPMLAAARLLAQAKVDCIVGSSTSAAWLGLDRDEALIEQIQAATDIPACTAMLAYAEIFRRTGAMRIGLVTPYLGEVQDRIVENLVGQGLACPAERHSGIAENFAFAAIAPESIAGMVRAVAAERPDAIAIVCANMPGAPLVQTLEQELDIPVYDSIAVVLWRSLLAVSVTPQRLAGWGRLFDDTRLQAAEVIA